jgi:hypothetical protein
MSRPRINRAARLIAAVAVLGGLGSTLAACSDDYWNRRETIGLSAGDAIAGNAAMQTTDPWPPGSGDKNIAFNGEKMQSAVQRYRTGKVTTPVDPEDFESTNQASQNVTTTVNTGAPPASTVTPAQ